jgi:hypothetical protein
MEFHRFGGGAAAKVADQEWRIPRAMQGSQCKGSQYKAHNTKAHNATLLAAGLTGSGAAATLL